MYTAIEPTTVNQTGVGVDFVLNYVFNAVDGRVFALIKDADGTVIQTHDVYIPPDIYAAWQQDDTIIDYVLEQLGLTKKS